MAADHHIRLRISGERTVEGELQAKGDLEFRIDDASKAAIRFDYREDDRLVIGLRSSTGFTIRGKHALALDGGVQYDLESEEWEGDVTAELEIGKDVKVEVRQTFTPDGNRTAVALEMVF